jgi:N-acetylglucosaminyldiphosphoundecaprenol N-acetyl-beta-D-mannosaminyltransferase
MSLLARFFATSAGSTNCADGVLAGLGHFAGGHTRVQLAVGEFMKHARREVVRGRSVVTDALTSRDTLRSKEIARISALGVGVSAINIPIAVAEIDRWIAEDRREYVCVTGMHGIVESRRNAELKRIHNAAGLVTPDGMPLVWLLWWYGHRTADRVYGPDLMAAVFERGVRRGWRHFLYGARPETLDRLHSKLLARFPGSSIVGRYSPPFGPISEEEDEKIVAAIRESGADIVWVGLSTPKQELWMASHSSRLPAKVLIGVGAAFDFHAGTVRQAPRFIQRSGLEWAFRLSTEPRRLWRRYLGNIPIFIWGVMLQIIHLRAYPLDEPATPSPH